MSGAFPETRPRSPTDSSRDRPDFVLTFWTQDPRLAGYANRAGVDRVGVDLEILGKRERQGGLGTWIARHRVDHIPDIARALTRAKLFARINPLHPGTRREVGELLDMGVEVLMLPMFTGPREVSKLVDMAGDRAHVVPLLETVAAAQRVEEIAAVEGISEIHVGINDLGLGMGIRNRFVVLTTRLMRRVVEAIKGAGLRLGVGGIGRALDDSLPVSSDLVYAQYPRLGATAAIISRQLLREQMDEADFRTAIRAARERMAYWFAQDDDALQVAHEALVDLLKRLTRQDPLPDPGPGVIQALV